MFRAIHLPLFLVFLAVAGCATNHVHPEFDQRVSAPVKATGLIVHIKSTGMEKGGLKHTPLANDEFVMYMAMRNMQQLFSPKQLAQMGSPKLHLPEELTDFGYSQSEAEHDTRLLAGLLKSAISDPQHAAQGDELAAVRRLASRGDGEIVLLGEIHSRIHTSDESRKTANFLSIMFMLGGQYVPAEHDTVRSKWVILDAADGKILRTLQDTWRMP